MMTARTSPLLLILAALPHLLDAQTTVTLSTSPNPSIFGMPVSLRAAVTPATATGSVTFYDGVTMLGTKPLAGGAASISTILLPAGNRKLTAYYPGDTANAAATSNTVSQTINAVRSNGFIAGSPLSAPATLLLAVADFNGDGKNDIVISNLIGNGGTLSILLGDGAGDFKVAFNLTAAGLAPFAAAVGDFNGDGITDLAVVNYPTSNVTILLGKGDGTFQSPVNYPVPNSVYGIYALAVGDFDGDGRADLATADLRTGVNILLGKGDGTFQSAVAYLTNPRAGVGFQTLFVLAEDFNGDGKADLATINSDPTFSVSGYSTVSILLGNGDGTFQPPVIVANLYDPRSLAVGDFNGDGKADLLVTVLGINNANILLGNGDGTFQKPLTYPTGSASPYSVAVGDFNGDGKPDLAFANPGDNVSILLGKGDGTFQPPAPYMVESGAPSIGSYSLWVGEFNGDGKTDLAVAGGNTASLLLGTTMSVTPTAGTPQSTTIKTQFPSLLQVTVRDGGSPVSGATVTFTAPSGAVTDQAPYGSPTANLSSDTAITDVNGVASVTATANSVASSYTVTAKALGVSVPFSLTNLAGPTLVITASPKLPQSTTLGADFSMPLQVQLTDPFPFTLPASGVTVTFTSPTSGASAVLSAETVATDGFGVASVTATANNFPGSYTVTASAGGMSATFSLTNLQTMAVTLVTSSNPSNLGAPLTLTATVANPAATGRVTFFDGVAALGTKTVASGIASFSTILLSAGTHNLTAYYRDDSNSIAGTSNGVNQTVKAATGGAFVPQGPPSIKPSSSPVVPGDFDGDGKVDIAFPTSGKVTVLLGKSDGTFQPPVDYPAATSRDSSIAAGGFNGDGKTDLAVTTLTTFTGSTGGIGYVSVLLGNGDGTFRPAVNYAATTNSSFVSSINAIAVGDFSGDGKPDILVAYKSIDTPSSIDGFTDFNLLPGNGDGTFGSAVSYVRNVSGTAYLVADFNGDGKPDLAVSGLIMLGNGDGTFQPPISFHIGDGAFSSLVAGDFNGDGKLDIAVGGFVTNGNSPILTLTTWILLGNGDGTFQPAVSYPFGEAVTSGDFNGDGLTDLVVAGFHTMGIRLGRGDGTFLEGPGISDDAPLAVADFNGDGKADILTSNSPNGTVTVLLGATSASFSLAVTGGAVQSAHTGNPFALPLQITLLNSGVPVSGATITFTVPASGAKALTLSTPKAATDPVLCSLGTINYSAFCSLTAVTNASGVAGVNATANFGVGIYVVSATYQGMTVTYSLTNTTLAAFLTASGGTPQSAVVGRPFISGLFATVKDALGNPLKGATVTFASPATGASATLSSATAPSSVDGVAIVRATANAIPGSYTVTASVGDLSVSFSLTNTADLAASIAGTRK